MTQLIVSAFGGGWGVGGGKVLEGVPGRGEARREKEGELKGGNLRPTKV